MSSKTEHLMHAIRRTPLFRQLVPQEAGVGWPIPLRKEGHVYVTLPCFGYAYARDKHETTLFPPLATITVAWSNGLPVEYVNLRFRNPWPEGPWEGAVGTFPHEAVARMKVEQYKAKRSELLAMYDELFDKLAQGSAFPTEWTEQFRTVLRTLMEPALEPYYRVLGARFFDRFLPREA